MKNKITFLILFNVLCFSCLQAQVTQEWVARYNGGFANSLAVDGLGNVYVTGYGYVTIKYNSAGDSLWAAKYNGAEVASSLVVDSSGNIYVTGIGRISSQNYFDFATIKYNSSGIQQWAQTYEGPVTGDWHLPSLAVDGSGNVYVTGQSQRSGTDFDYTTIKYSSSGDSLWVARYNGPENGRDVPYSIAVDKSGNVYVTGGSYGIGTRSDYATIKYNSSGDALWVARYNGPSNSTDWASALVIDDLENVYITGSSSGIGTDFATIKYNSSGDIQWIQRYDEPGYNDFAYSLKVDGSNNVYVTGYSGIGFANGYDYATIKYNSSGIQQWVQRYVGPEDLGVVEGEVEISIAVDSSENIYVTGCSYVNGSDRIHDYATIKYNSSGDSLWVQRYHGMGTGWDGAHSIAVDNYGNVYVTGRSTGIGTDINYATIKYSQTKGITAPSKLNAQSVDSSFIKLTWQDNSDDEDGFYVERTKINDSSHWEIIDAVPQNVNHYEDYFVTRNLKYYYRVNAYSGNIFSGYSNTDSAILGGEPALIPAPPSKLTFLKRTPKAISMGWHDNSGNENGFIIFRRSERDLFFKIIDSVNTDVVTYQEVGVSPNLNYYYKICSFNASGISDYSNTLFVSSKSSKTPELSGNSILFENYPNPFNPVTNLEFWISKLGFASLKIYDMLGKEVVTLVNANLNPGTYKYNFDASALPSGVYFYKLTVDGNIIDTKRMMLLK